MGDWRSDFGPFEGHVWLNCAHQGPLPKPAITALEEALAMKRSPHRLPNDLFWDVPKRLKRAVSELINASPDEIVLGNSLSYGLHLLVRGLNWNEGDEILLLEGDFPATTLPWQLLDEQGVTRRYIDPNSDIGLDDQLADAITENTRVFCATWVDSFTGRRLNLDALGSICKEQNVWFVVNGAQGVGACEIDVSATPVDVLMGVGYKWLCGPYGTGFTWFSPRVLAELSPVQAYWLPMQAGTELTDVQQLSFNSDLGAAGYDVFGTANFNNFMPWTAAIEYLNDVGIDRIAEHGQRLMNRLLEGIEPSPFNVLTPTDSSRRANILVLSHTTDEIVEMVFDQLNQRNIHAALREGNIRISPHLYNTTSEIDSVIEVFANATTTN